MMIKITGTQEEVDNFMDIMVCPIDDNEGTLQDEDCPYKDDLGNAECIECVISTYGLELVYED